MNFSRGFFRLWILFSVSWIVFVIFIFFNDISSAYYSNANLNRVDRNIEKMVEQKAPKKEVAEYIKSEGYTPQQILSHNRSNVLQKIIGLFGMMASFPLLLATVYHIIAWVIRGFKYKEA